METIKFMSVIRWYDYKKKSLIRNERYWKLTQVKETGTERIIFYVSYYVRFISNDVGSRDRQVMHLALYTRYIWCCLVI